MHQDIAGAVVVEVARAVDLPVSATYRQRWGGRHRNVVHHQVPQRHRSITAIDPVLQDVAGSIPTEVADGVHLPVRPVYPDGGGRLHRVVVHYQHLKLSRAGCEVVPMLQDVAGAIVVEVADAVHDPIHSAHGDLDLG